MPLDEDPRSGFTGKWTSGIFLASVAAVWGLWSLLHSRLILPRRRWGGYTLEGGPAILLSIALISFGFYLHFHYFWGTDPKADHISTPGERTSRGIGLSCLATGLVWHFIQIGT